VFFIMRLSYCIYTANE